MKLWIIEPRDPLIVRDGRPFGPTPGARSVTLPFPFPSTVIGALRHKAGLDANGQFDHTQKDAVLKMSMLGPLLVQIDNNDTVIDWLLPAPADALIFDLEQVASEMDNRAKKKDKIPSKVLRRWIAPCELIAKTNIPDGLLPISPIKPPSEKVSAAAPHFWYRDMLWQWLNMPTNDEQPLESLGIRNLEINTRMHVSILPEQQTAREGALFQTSGLEFAWRNWKQAEIDVFDTKRLALAAWFDGNTPHFSNGFAPMGGERRLMRWGSASVTKELSTNADRDRIYEQIEKDRCCRVMLLTPAYFSAGYRPPIDWTRNGITATLVAAAVPRMQTISGWDLAAERRDARGRLIRGAPKPTRRLAPAGSVYFVKFPSGVDVQKWLDQTWLKNISDDEQACLDGFGLAVLGVWKQEETK